LEKKYLNEFKLSEEFLEIAKINSSLSFRSSANRLYFSFEKAVVSYLLSKNLKVPKNHQKMWELCSDYLGEEYYLHLRRLYDLRMQGDYGNISVFIVLNKTTLQENISKTEVLIKKIKEELK
jgi:uncharacterized protein (UPF0332 family)